MPVPMTRQKYLIRNSSALRSWMAGVCRNSTICGQSRVFATRISSSPARYTPIVPTDGPVSAHQNSIPIKAYSPASSPITAPKSILPSQFCRQERFQPSNQGVGSSRRPRRTASYIPAQNGPAIAPPAMEQGRSIRMLDTATA